MFGFFPWQRVNQGVAGCMNTRALTSKYTLSLPANESGLPKPINTVVSKGMNQHVFKSKTTMKDCISSVPRTCQTSEEIKHLTLFIPIICSTRDISVTIPATWVSKMPQSLGRPLLHFSVVYWFLTQCLIVFPVPLNGFVAMGFVHLTQSIPFIFTIKLKLLLLGAAQHLSSFSEGKLCHYLN